MESWNVGIKNPGDRRQNLVVETKARNPEPSHSHVSSVICPVVFPSFQSSIIPTFQIFSSFHYSNIPQLKENLCLKI
jgi:hypothetical protein